MRKCPNCGQPTERTEDWACQWCGYPLLSPYYKKIAKTYKQLEEERRYKERESVPEGRETVPSSLPPRRALPLKRIPEPEAISEPEPEVVPEEPELISEPEAVPESEAELELVSEPEAALEAEVAEEAEPELVSEPEVALKAEVALETAPEIAPGVIEISVTKLASAFQSDKVAANTKLANKILRVKGVVDKVVVMGHLEIRYVLLTAEGKGLWNVRCTFGAGYESKLSRLTQGEMVTVQGKYDGYERNIFLKDCVLVR